MTLPERETQIDPLPKLVTVDPRTGSSQPRGAAPDPEHTRFESWFVEQYSTRQSAKSAGRLVDDVSRAKHEMEKAINLRDRCVEWDRRYDAALKAWMAREAIAEQKAER